MVIYSLLVEVELVELRKLKIKVGVFVVVECGGVLAVIHGTIGLNEGGTLKHVICLVILVDSDIEIADDAFVFLELQFCPLAIVDKLFKCLLQIVEHTFVCHTHLGTVYHHLS